jgi:tricorn protease
VENYGTDPDIDVDNAPQDTIAGRDRQLERALEVALQRVAQNVVAPPFGPRPNLARPPLPPRP